MCVSVCDVVAPSPTEKRHCMVYDIVFHTNTYEKGEKAR